MGDHPTLYLFPNLAAENQFLISQGVSPKTAFLIPENERFSILRSLQRSCEEREGEPVPYWAGTLWDIPAVRGFLKDLQEQTQQSVLEKIDRACHQSQMSFYQGRDGEGLRCLQEMLTPEERVLSTGTWRELVGLCRTTSFEWGTFPWDIILLSEKDPQPMNIKQVYLIRFTKKERPEADCSVPSWIAEIPAICATASQCDNSGKSLYPLADWALRHSWTLEPILPGKREIGSRGEGRLLVSPIFRKTERQGKWEQFLEKRIFSVSELERYAQSPFAYFAEYVLRLRPPEKETLEWTGIEIGSLAHRVLEVFFKKSRDDFTGEGLEKELLEILDTEIASLQETQRDRDPVLIGRQKDRLFRALKQLLVKDLEDFEGKENKLVPTFFEWEFGNGNVPPLTLQIPNGKTVRLRGRVDRIDVDHQKKTFRVIDYKTGARRISGNDIEQGTALQLPLYIEAVRQLLLPHYTPTSGQIFSLYDMTQRDGLLRHKWHHLIEHSIKKVGEIVEALYGACFPVEKAVCADFCPYQDICRCREINA